MSTAVATKPIEQETAAEHLRNALQVLRGSRRITPLDGEVRVPCEVIDAIENRLVAALGRVEQDPVDPLDDPIARLLLGSLRSEVRELQEELRESQDETRTTRNKLSEVEDELLTLRAVEKSLKAFIKTVDQQSMIVADAISPPVPEGGIIRGD